MRRLWQRGNAALPLLLLVATLLCGAEPVFVLPDALRESDDVAALTAFADTQEEQGSHDLAAEALRRALTVQPDDPELSLRLAEDLYRSGEAGKPEAFRLADALLSNSGLAGGLALRALQLRGMLCLEQQMPEPARSDFSTVLAAQPANARATIGLAGVEVATGDIVAASKRLDALGAAAQPYDAETRYLLRWTLESFTRDRRTFTDTGENHAAYGKLLYRAGRLAEAVSPLRRAALLQATNTETWNLVAAICAQMGNAEETRAACQASLAIKPDQPEIQELLRSVGK